VIGSKPEQAAVDGHATRVIHFPQSGEPVTLPEADGPLTPGSELSAAARWWFAALDGTSLGEGKRRCAVHVAGMEMDGEDLWIQLQSADNPAETCLVHVIRGASWYVAMSSRPPEA